MEKALETFQDFTAMVDTNSRAGSTFACLRLKEFQGTCANCHASAEREYSTAQTKASIDKAHRSKA